MSFESVTPHRHCDICNTNPTNLKYHSRVCLRKKCSCDYPDLTSATPNAISPKVITRDPEDRTFHCLRCSWANKDADKMVVSVVVFVLYVTASYMSVRLMLAFVELPR
jgi:hypothetical protein